ncbi:MAG TPA: hypothetical protein VI488_02215 [Candidatus Angelobacter sp.]
MNKINSQLANAAAEFWWSKKYSGNERPKIHPNTMAQLVNSQCVAFMAGNAIAWGGECKVSVEQKGRAFRPAITRWEAPIPCP